MLNRCARHLCVLALGGAALLVGTPAVFAQEAPDSTVSVDFANPADVETVDAIINAFYDVISGPVGEARDWNRFRSLFAAGARLIPSGLSQRGEAGFTMITPMEYVERVGPNLTNMGFTQDEIGRTTEIFGTVTHAFSAYQSFRLAGDSPETPFSRGINSIQIFNDGFRYWILNIFWDSERPGNPIPEKFGGS